MVNAASTTYTGNYRWRPSIQHHFASFSRWHFPPPGRTLAPRARSSFLHRWVQSITEVDRGNHPTGYVQQWNVSLEQQLPGKFSFVAAYVGSRGTHLAQYSQQVNQIFRQTCWRRRRRSLRRWKARGCPVASDSKPIRGERAGAGPGRFHHDPGTTAKALPSIYERRTRWPRFL